MASLTVKLTLKYKPSLTATISGSNWIFVGFFSKRHLSGAWHVRAIHTHATTVARGVQSVNTDCNKKVLKKVE